MKTLKQLAELIQERETDLAPGSETALLGVFVNEYDYTDTCINERADEQVEDWVYDAWKEAYNKMEQFDADPNIDDYELSDLF